MKRGFLLVISAILVMVVLACQKEVTSSNENHREQMPTVTRDEKSSNQKGRDSQVWIPEVIKKCVAKVDVGEPLEMDTSVNPFYLRANFDGNRLVDYAVVVNGQKTRKRGVVICKDSTKAYIFGSVTKPKEPFTGIEDDNFVTENWEILSVEESNTSMIPPVTKLQQELRANQWRLFLRMESYTSFGMVRLSKSCKEYKKDEIPQLI